MLRGEIPARQFRTALRLPKKLMDSVDTEVDRLNNGLPEPMWDRSKVIRTILRKYFEKESKGGDTSESKSSEN